MFSLLLKRAMTVCFIITAAIVIDYYFNLSRAWLWRDILLGGMAGFVISIVLFPRRVAYDFRRSMVSLFNAYSEYLSAITQLFLHENVTQFAQDKKYEVEKLLQPPFFPEWVYKTGFSVFFRAGHRHFLVRAEQVGQILFAMHYTVRYANDFALIDRLGALIEQCVSRTQELMSVLIVRLELKEQKITLPDLIEDITMLENVYREMFPLSIEFLEMSDNAVYLAAFIYDLKDLRKVLLKLVEALR